MQSKPMRVLGLVAALGTVSCGGDSAPTTDAYVGYVDGTGLDSKFVPGSYKPQKVSAGGAALTVYNFGLVFASAVQTDAAKRPALQASKVTTTVYQFGEGCQTVKEFDPRLDAYRQDVQYPIFDALPLATTSSSAPAVLPLVHVVQWTGTAEQPCNGIKSDESLAAGVFGGAAAEGSTVALRAVIDMTASFTPLRTGSTFAPQAGWYQGLQLQYLDGGELPVDEAGNVKAMDGVLVHPATTEGSAPKLSKTTDDNVLVLAAAPGSAEWSPVVRLREYTIPSGSTATPASFKSLCYDSPCAAGQLDVSSTGPLATAKYTGLLFLVGSAQ